MDTDDERSTAEVTAPDDEATTPDQSSAPDSGQRPPKSPVGRGGALPHLESSEDEVEDASEESFPASDPPSYSNIT